VGLIVLATHNASEFRTSFNAFMHQFSNSPDYYGLVVRRARAAGYTQHFSLLQTVQAIPLVTFMVMAWGSTYLSGEIKQIQRSALRGMGFTLIALVVIETINYYLTARMVGTYFWGGISSQWLNGTLPSFPLSPYFNLFATVATGNSFSIVAINLSYALFTLVYIPLDYLVCSRLLFSWSFDRLLPERVTRVSDRTHSPTVAVIAVLVVAEIYLAIYVYTTWLTTFATIAATCLVLFLAALSALLLPVRMPTVYRVSPASRWRIGRVPVITIAGAVGVAFFGVLVYAFVSDDRYLANGKMSLLILLIEFLVGVAIYLTALVVRRRREGTDIRLAFREVPPE
jgi:amino acid transporter